MDGQNINGKLSVIIPVYNVKEYLEKCVDSILSQNYDLFEVILVDDGSTDGSGYICDQYASKDCRIKVIHQKNQGHTAARQSGFAASSGEYLLFIDSDDWIDRKMFHSMMTRAMETDADIVQCSYRSVKDGRGRDEVPIYETGVYGYERLKAEIYPKMIYAGGFYRFGIAPNMWNKIFKRHLIEDNLPRIDRRIRSGEDGLLTFSCFLQARTVCIVPGCYYNYRSREVSMCRITDDSRLDQNHILFEYYKKWFYENPILKEQIEHYVVYQTLQAVTGLLRKRTIRRIKKEHSFLKENSLERTSIQNVPISDVAGKKNKLILAGLKI